MTPVTICPASTLVHGKSVGVSMASLQVSKRLAMCQNEVKMGNAGHTLSEAGTSIEAEIINKNKNGFLGLHRKSVLVGELCFSMINY